jgi:hypothetical protein
VSSAPNRDEPPTASIARSLTDHDAALATLLRGLRARENIDIVRADALRKVVRAHPGERVIAFSHYAETVNAFRALLAADPGVATLTSTGARVAGGRITRDDVLSQFNPDLSAGPQHECDHISLLIATDLLSEGLNLQEASVIVHLDLPWNPARLEQRVGRARRLGSRHDVVSVYAFAPPASAERMLRIERRLHEKLALSAASIGRSPPALPSLVQAPDARRGHAETASEIVVLLRSWSAANSESASTRITAHVEASTSGYIGSDFGIGDQPPVVAAVESEVEGFVVLIVDDSQPRLIASVAGDIGESLETLRGALMRCAGQATAVSDVRLDDTLSQLHRWISDRRGAMVVDVRRALATNEKRAALRRIAKTLASVPRHQRSRLAPLAAAARCTITEPMTEGAERMLDELIDSSATGESWLSAIADLGIACSRLRPRPQTSEKDGTILAVILLQRP